MRKKNFRYKKGPRNDPFYGADICSLCQNPNIMSQAIESIFILLIFIKYCPFKLTMKVFHAIINTSMRLFEIDKQVTGTYAGVHFDQDTLDQIVDFQHGSSIPNPLAADKMHSTMVYSQVELPDYEAADKVNWKGTFTEYDIFGKEEEDEYCLVMKYDCPEMLEKWEHTMATTDATWDHDGFHPHITLSYDVGPDFNIDNLPPYEGPINITSEYVEELELEWAEHNTD